MEKKKEGEVSFGNCFLLDPLKINVTCTKKNEHSFLSRLLALSIVEVEFRVQGGGGKL